MNKIVLLVLAGLFFFRHKGTETQLAKPRPAKRFSLWHIDGKSLF